MTTTEKFANDVFTVKTHQMFPVHTTPEGFDHTAVTGHFRFVFEEDSSREILWLSQRHRFQKALFAKCFPSALKRKSGVSKFLRFEERFEEIRFRSGLVWTVGLTVEMRLHFRDGLVWTVGLTEDIKLHFRDGLVWTVGLTVEIKLRFQISPTRCGQDLKIKILGQPFFIDRHYTFFQV